MRRSRTSRKMKTAASAEVSALIVVEAEAETAAWRRTMIVR